MYTAYFCRLWSRLGRTAVPLLAACLLAAGVQPALGDGCCPPETEQPDPWASPDGICCPPDGLPDCYLLDGDRLPLPPTYVLCNGSGEVNSTIKVEIGTTGTEANPNGWGGGITGIYYRDEPGDPELHPWGTNMIHNLPGGLAQVSLYEGPPSQYFSHTSGWNVFQGCHPEGTASPAWITGQGTSPVPWLSIRTYPLDSSVERDDCVQLDQKVLLYGSYIEVQYSVSQRPNYPPPPTQHPASHPVMFHEGPCIFGWPGITYNPTDADRLNIERMYDGTSPWSAGGLTEPVVIGSNQVYPSEDWLGLFRQSDEYGLTLAYPSRTRHQPYCHMWAFHEDCCLQIAWARPFFDIVRDSGETISWTVYVIPGEVATGRKWAYELLPHPKWEFALDGCFEGWHPAGQLSGLSVQGGLLKAKSNGTSPKIESLAMLDFASDPIRGIELRMSVTAGSQGSVYYITEEEQTWDDAKSKTFTVTPDGAFHTYSVRLDQRAGWGGKTIRALRLRPTSAATGADGIQIDYIRIWNFPPTWLYAAEFNAEGNNEGWMPVTTQLSDPVWPANVTGGNLVLQSGGNALDEYTDPDTTISPTLLGPYPTYIAPPAVGHKRTLKVRLQFSGTIPGMFMARARYTRTDTTKVFDYHPTVLCPYPCEPPDKRPAERPEDCICEEPCTPWVDPAWPYYKPITRFDLADIQQGIDGKVWPGLSQNTWLDLTWDLPSTGTIDQLEFVPTNKPGDVYIDYIKVVDLPA
jgi:hypothetical protein